MKVRMNHVFCLIAVCAFLLPKLSLSQELFPYNREGQAGYEDRSGKVVLKGLEIAEPLKGGVAFARKKGSWGAINSKAEVIIDFTYSNLVLLSPNVIKATAKSHYDMYSNEGKLILKELKDLNNLKNHLDTFVACKSNGKYGLVDVRGKKVVPFKFDSPPIEAYPSEYFFKKRDKNTFRMGVVDLNGKEIVPLKYRRVNTVFDEYYRAETDDGTTDCFDRNGDIVYAGNDDPVFFISPEYIIVERGKNQQLLLRKSKASYLANRWVRRGELVYCTDTSTRILLPDLSMISIDDPIQILGTRDKYMSVRLEANRNNGAGLMNYEGSYVIDPVYSEIADWNDRWAAVRKERNGKFGLYDFKEKRLIFDVEYDNIEIMNCGFIRTFKGSEIVTMDSTFTPISDQELNDGLSEFYYTISEERLEKLGQVYQRIHGNDWDGAPKETNDCGERIYKTDALNKCEFIFDAQQKSIIPNRLKVSVGTSYSEKFGIVDCNGKSIVPIGRYHNIDRHKEGFIQVSRFDSLDFGRHLRWGLINADGKVVLDVDYDAIYYVVNGFAICEVHGVFQMIHLETKQRVLAEMDKISYVEAYQLIAISKDYYGGYANLDGEVIIPPRYLDLKFTDESRTTLKGKRNDVWYYVDLKGNETPIE